MRCFLRLFEREVMETKEKVKGWLKYLLLLPILIGAVLALVLTLPDGKTDSLSVVAEDVVLKVGAEETLEYDVNIRHAVCSFKVEDETIVVFDENDKSLLGVSKGETKLTVTAKFGNETSVATVSVLVVGDEITDIDSPLEVPDEDVDDVEENPIKVLIDDVEVDEIVLGVGESIKITVDGGEYRVEEVSCDGVLVEKIKFTTGSYELTATEANNYVLVIHAGSSIRRIPVVVKA